MGLIDEIRDHEEKPLNEVVLPLMNVSRRLPDNTVNEKEPNQQQICMTSAGVKTSFAKTKKFVGEVKPCEPIIMGCEEFIFFANSESLMVTLCQALYA